jgi:epoxyqueuosine reductase QueG
MLHLQDFTTHLQAEGADLVGFANIEGLASDGQQAFPYGISLGVALHPQIIAGIHHGPTHEYYAEYERANHLLERLGQHAAGLLREHGHQALCLTVTDKGVEPNPHAPALPHKTVATRAGLGWIGKCALLITEAFGPAIRLTTVFTNATLPPGTPVTTSQCGTCTACVDACPGHAPSGKEWHVERHRDQFFDALACRHMAREMAATRIRIRDTICGICIAACPWTQRYRKRYQAQMP